MRGRVLHPSLAAIHRLDTTGTDQAGGYDERFRTTTTSYPLGVGGPRQKGRAELPEIRLRCQVETGQMEAQRQGPGGNVPDMRLTLVFHFRDLERADMIGTDGIPTLRVNDRLDALYTVRGILERRWPNPPGLYCVEVREQSHGLSSQRRNLLVTIWDDRRQGVESAQ